jgi:pyruvate ferredoxin oxidoreductase alpha subunit
MSAPARKLVPPYGATYTGAIDLAALRRAHRPRYPERARLSVDGNTAAAIPFTQWWRSPIVAGFPITPATKWLEHLAAEVASGAFDVDVGGRKVRAKRVKLLESEHAAADYVGGVAASCRDLVVGTASSSVGLDHMAESIRSLGASGLGNVMVVNVSRATANYPLCIEGDSSDTLAHRDDGFIQVICRGKQQIYDTLLQLPAIGMHPDVLTPTMPAYCGIKDSHRIGVLTVEPDDEVNDFLDAGLALGGETPPGLLDGDTAMGNCVTSAWFQGFKAGQKRRQQAVFDVLPRVAELFRQRFGRPGIEPLELHGVDDADVALVASGPDAGTAIQIQQRLTDELGAKVGVVVVRLLTPFPARELAEALAGVDAVGVVNQAHHHGRGHLTLDVVDALAAVGLAPPIEAFFCGLGGADVSVDSWRHMARVTIAAGQRGRPDRRWRIVHEGRDVLTEEV